MNLAMFLLPGQLDWLIKTIQYKKHVCNFALMKLKSVDGLAWNLIWIPMFSRLWVLMTLVWSLTCPYQAKIFTYFVKYLNIYMMDLHTIWYRYS